MKSLKDFNDSRNLQIGLNIAKYRKLNGMTQEHLARLIGVSPTYLMEVESVNYIRSVPLKMIYAIADLYHIPPKKLMEHD